MPYHVVGKLETAADDFQVCLTLALQCTFFLVKTLAQEDDVYLECNYEIVESLLTLPFLAEIEFKGQRILIG